MANANFDSLLQTAYGTSGTGLSLTAALYNVITLLSKKHVLKQRLARQTALQLTRKQVVASARQAGLSTGKVIANILHGEALSLPNPNMDLDNARVGNGTIKNWICNGLLDRDDFDHCELDEFMLWRGFAYVADQQTYLSVDEVFCCDSCGKHYILDQQSDAYDEDGDIIDNICVRCTNARQCDVSGLYFHEDVQFEALYDGDGDVIGYFALQYCVDRGEVEEVWNYDESKYVYVVAGTQMRNGLAGYHSAPRAWMQGRIPPPNAFGVELEVAFPRDNDFHEFLRKNVHNTGELKNLPFICERDGSLDDIPNGLEIISEPLSFHAGYVADDAPWRQMLKMLYAAGAVGWEYRGEAGIHVNMDTRHMSENDMVKYAVFINNARALSCFIAGRQNIFNGAYRRHHKSRNATAEDVFSRGKYSAVNRRSATCLETRIFGANIKYAGFMACVEYCAAAARFVQEMSESAVFSPIAGSRFRAWLGEHTKRYPNLARRLGSVEHAASSATPSTAKVSPILEAA